ncbi:hypothetical protein N657DRAFT_684736 [Parathielavia appendiculata]|uniref:Cupin type-1 domain-containing protein n=1 Tax=Parathielavia appendiculata TaxID=2587402 RepID=A0AAN6TRN6_9PEZI|nr:hypothetical protein N657DRAFT_684736 [Parathielavia appendiculata]
MPSKPSPTITPLPSLTTETHHIPPHPTSPIPNSSPTTGTGKPLLLYRRAFPNLPVSEKAAQTIERHLRQVGAVEPQWRYGMYATSHFHSTTHEVLCVFSGRAKLLFGGEGNPGAVETVVERGDVIVLPAGVAHRLVADLSSSSSSGPTAAAGEEEGEDEGGACSGRFEMVGGYPVGGEQWDMCYGREGEEGRVQGIKRLGWFEKDPIYGDQGPVLEV